MDVIPIIAFDWKTKYDVEKNALSDSVSNEDGGEEDGEFMDLD